MKLYTISDRQLREFARVIGEEARRPLLEFIRNLMSDIQAINEDVAKLRKDFNSVGSDDAPPIAPRE
jgi:hypothetical protein